MKRASREILGAEIRAGLVKLKSKEIGSLALAGAAPSGGCLIWEISFLRVGG
jgi:hypothetical protein